MLSTPRMEIIKQDEVVCGPLSWKRKKAVILKQDKHQLQHTTSAFPIEKKNGYSQLIFKYYFREEF